MGDYISRTYYCNKYCHCDNKYCDIVKFDVCKSYNRMCPCLKCKERYKCIRVCNEQELENGVAVDTNILCNKAKEYCEKTHGISERG